MASPNLLYEPVEAFADTDEDWPGPRCGHTLTPIIANGSQKLVLFGGTSIGDSLFQINLAGVTNSVHCFDVSTRTWTRLNTCGDAPSPRSCHAATAVRTYLLIQGGLTLNGPGDEDVYVLDIASNDHMWRRLYVEGITPGLRYGHVMGLASERWLVIFGGFGIFGGTTRNRILSDTWALDTRTPPRTYMWRRLNPSGNLPSARRYASACIVQSGCFFLFGGRDRLGMPLGDAYELEIVSITQSSWTVSNAGVAPCPRSQHSAVYDGTRMHVIGGVVTWNHLIEGEATVAVLNTVTGQWLERNLPENSAVRELQYQRMRRCLHDAAFIGGRIYVYGGRGSADLLLEDLLVSESSHPPPPEPLSNGH